MGECERHLGTPKGTRGTDETLERRVWNDLNAVMSSS